MKLFFLIIASAFFTFANAKPINTYEELTSAISEGKHFAILLDLENGKGYFTPKAMMLTSDYVTTSDLHFTEHSGRPTYEYVKYTIHSDNSATVQVTFYDPAFVPKGSHTIHCALNNGLEIHTD
jgi:hypothetical protein